MRTQLYSPHLTLVYFEHPWPGAQHCDRERQMRGKGRYRSAGQHPVTENLPYTTCTELTTAVNLGEYHRQRYDWALRICKPNSDFSIREESIDELEQLKWKPLIRRAPQQSSLEKSVECSLNICCDHHNFQSSGHCSCGVTGGCSIQVHCGSLREGLSVL